jgi:hypothetical protein
VSSLAQDRLDIAEFEARLDRAHRATAPADLEALLQDLPAAAAERRPAGAVQDTLARGGERLRGALRDTRTMLAFMGGVERRGHWTPGRKNTVLAIMGGVVLDFREVTLPPGETEVFVCCLMGGAEIIVPPELAVESSGIAVVGGFAAAARPHRADADAPLLRINGVCLMGGVEVQVRKSGETAKDGHDRARLERREQRRRLRGEE